MQFEQGRFGHLEGAEALAGKAVRALYEDSSGHLWVGTSGGELACVAGGQCRSWIAEPRSTEDAVTGILGSEDGDLWFGTSRGIYRVAAMEAKQWLAGQSAMRPQLFFEIDAPASAALAQGWPRALRSPDGRFWFAHQACGRQGNGPMDQGAGARGRAGPSGHHPERRRPGLSAIHLPAYLRGLEGEVRAGAGPGSPRSVAHALRAGPAQRAV